MVTHYLIQPHGQPAIAEHGYDGYGNWGGGSVNLYEWVARTNADHIGFDADAFDSDRLREIGVALLDGTAFEDTRNGSFWWIGRQHPVPGAAIEVTGGPFDHYSQALGGTPNDLIDKGILVERPIRELVSLPYPIKISAYPFAKYEDLPESGICPYGGYGFPDDPAEFQEATGFVLSEVFPDTIDPDLRKLLEEDNQHGLVMDDDEDFDDGPSMR